MKGGFCRKRPCPLEAGGLCRKEGKVEEVEGGKEKGRQRERPSHSTSETKKKVFLCVSVLG